MPLAARSLPVGKLPQTLLSRLLKRYASRRDPSVLQGPGVGEDAAVLRVGGRLLAAKTDPITFVADDAAAYALTVNANDVATRGARPRWFLATLLLPEGRTTPADVERHFRGLDRACRALGVTLVGGHCEVTYGLPRPIVVGCLLGEVQGRALATADARAGDDLLLTKGAAIEAVSVIAREKAASLAREFPAAFLKRCRAFSERLSVVPEAEVARRLGARAMHDPTEGGVATAIHEMCEAAGLGVALDAAVPVPPEARALCGHFGLDPLGALSSGALLIASPPARRRGLLAALARKGIPAARIGAFTRSKRRLAGGRPLKTFARDEVARLFEK